MAAIQTSIAALVGATAGYFGGWADKVTSRVIDLLLVIPSFLLIAIVSQKFSGDTSSFGHVHHSSIHLQLDDDGARGAFTDVVPQGAGLRDRCKYMSVPPLTIITRHILPNISSLLIVDFTLAVVSAVLSKLPSPTSVLVSRIPRCPSEPLVQPVSLRL